MRVRSAMRILAAALVIATVACSKDPEAVKRDHFARGNQYLEQQKYNEAIVELKNAVQADPKFGEARARLGAAYLKVGNNGDALRELVRAADLLPQSADAQLQADRKSVM